jgi:hypothetical protein
VSYLHDAFDLMVARQTSFIAKSSHPPIPDNKRKTSIADSNSGGVGSEGTPGASDVVDSVGADIGSMRTHTQQYEDTYVAV